MNIKLLYGVLITGIMTLTACSRDSSTDLEFIPTEIWGGVYDSRNGYNISGSIMLYLNRDNVTVTGRYKTSTGGEGTVDGTITDTSANLTLTQSSAINCPGSFSITGQVLTIGEDITARFSGRDCNGSQGGTARIIAISPESSDSNFTGTYSDPESRRSAAIISISTKNSVDYSGSISEIRIIYHKSKYRMALRSADVNGSLGNDEGRSLMSLELTNVEAEYFSYYTTGEVKIYDMYQDANGFNHLNAAYDFSTSKNDIKVYSGKDMLQIK